MEGTRILITKKGDQFSNTSDEFNNDTRVIPLKENGKPALAIIDHTVGIRDAGTKQTTILLLTPDLKPLSNNDLQKTPDGLFILKGNNRVTILLPLNMVTDIAKIDIFRIK